VLDDLAAEVNEGEGHVLQARVGRLVEIHAFVPGKADEPFGMQKAWAVQGVTLRISLGIFDFLRSLGLRETVAREAVFLKELMDLVQDWENV